jgi:hypothetical protein
MTTTIAAQVQMPAGTYGDAGSATTMALELLSLEGDRLRREASEKVGPFMYVYHVPGQTIEQRTTVGTRTSCLDIIEDQLSAELEKFGLTVDSLFEPGCPIKFAAVYSTREGNLAAEGNWPEMYRGLSTMLGVLNSSLLGDDFDLEVFSA